MHIIARLFSKQRLPVLVSVLVGFFVGFVFNGVPALILATVAGFRSVVLLQALAYQAYPLAVADGGPDSHNSQAQFLDDLLVTGGRLPGLAQRAYARYAPHQSVQHPQSGRLPRVGHHRAGQHRADVLGWAQTDQVALLVHRPGRVTVIHALPGSGSWDSNGNGEITTPEGVKWTASSDGKVSVDDAAATGLNRMLMAA